jgi:hypothetical protein
MTFGPVPGQDAGYWTGAITNSDAGVTVTFGAADDSGTTWTWGKLAGWDSAPVQGGGVLPRSGGHGAWATPQFYAARQLTLTCSAAALSQALRDEARALLQEAVPVNGLAQLLYNEPVPKVTMVRRSGQVGENCPTLVDVDFTIGLVAPDPRKYAAAAKSLTISPAPVGGGGGMVVPFTVPFTLDSAPPPGAGTTQNNGNFGCPPVTVIAGPVAAPSVACLTSGQTVTWSTLTLGAGDVLVADHYLMQAVVNPTAISTFPGTPSTGGTYWPADVTSRWWSVPKGASGVQLGGATGNGCTATVWYRDCWS